MIYKCDKPMARHKMRSNRLSEGWRCDHSCETCVCALKKNEDGTWEHVQLKDKPTNPKGGKFV